MKNKIETTGDGVKITRIFDARREAVFAAWADPEKAGAWMGCPGSSSVSCTMDFRAGGGYRQVLEVPGCGQVVMVGRYKEIEVPKRISYALNCEPCEGMEPAPDTHVTVEFIERGDQTEVRLEHTGLASDEMKGMISSGHEASFDRLAELVEKK
ncbi:MAG TPA: SRPBCC domain-containing protein [Verrucomicrobiales bacterium]|nr:SRPBCC domain-containing protein [Verrucomicrobiales bacterium]